MANFKVVQHFNDREGKEEYDAKKLKKYTTGDSYESSNSEWTDYLVKKGFLKSVSKETSTVKAVNPNFDMKTKKDDIIAELERLEISHDSSSKKEDLLKLLVGE